MKFKVAAISDNRNGFGLRSMIVIAENGETWKVLASSVHEKPVGYIIDVHCLDVHPNGEPVWARHHFECPEKLPNAPAKVIAEVWNETVPESLCSDESFQR